MPLFEPATGDPPNTAEDDRQEIRGFVAIVAWPVGVMAAIVSTFILTPSGNCGTTTTGLHASQTCAVAGVTAGAPVSWKEVVFLAIALGPGLLATAHWWRNRRNLDEEG